MWENSWSHRCWEVSLWSLCLQLGQTKGLRACSAPGKVAHYTTWWEQGCTLPVQAAPRTAGILLTAEPSLRQCWELLVPPSYFPASSSLFPNGWVHAKLLLPGSQAALLISSHYPRNLLSGWLVQAVLPDLPACATLPPGAAQQPPPFLLLSPLLGAWCSTPLQS